MNRAFRTMILLLVLGACFSMVVPSVLINAADAAAPNADAGPDQSATVGTRVNFDASLSSVTSGTANYTWSFMYNGVETKMYGVRPSFLFTIPGTYAITLNLTDPSTGTYDTDQMVVTVTNKTAETTSLVFSGGAAVAVAALLIGVFLSMRKSKGYDEDDGPEEEEFEDDVDETQMRSGKPES